MEIRDAVDADLATITDIYNQAMPNGDAEWTEVFHTVDDARRVSLRLRALGVHRCFGTRVRCR